MASTEGEWNPLPPEFHARGAAPHLIPGTETWSTIGRPSHKGGRAVTYAECFKPQLDGLYCLLPACTHRHVKTHGKDFSNGWIHVKAQRVARLLDGVSL